MFTAKLEWMLCLLVIFRESTFFFILTRHKKQTPTLFFSTKMHDFLVMTVFAFHDGTDVAIKFPPHIPTSIHNDTTASGYNNIIIPAVYIVDTPVLEHHLTFPDLHPLDFQSCNYII